MRRILLLLLAVPVSARLATAKVQKVEAPVAKETLELYRTKCQVCHGPNGASAQKPVNLANGEWKHGSSTAAIVKTISEGVKGTAMMPFKGKLTGAQIAGLARLVRSFDKSLEPEKSRER
jgi:mono/diheme cytochrome c family protein